MNCDNHDDCMRRILDIENRLDSTEESIAALQIISAANDEKVKSMFAMLNDIKTMLKDYTVEMKASMLRLAEDIERLKGRPTRFADGAMSSAIAALIGAAVMYFIGGR